MRQQELLDEHRQGEPLMLDTVPGPRGLLYLESYGCAMNFSDSEIVASIMQKEGFATTPDIDQADVVLVNTCAIRDNAEQRVRGRLADFARIKAKKPSVIIGVLGCMAERLKTKLLEEEKMVDLVAGPDAYRDLPNLVSQVESGQKAVNVFLSRDETYAEIAPVRLGSNGVSAFISIMRGCDNMCSFCVVPYTRGRERSRDPETIVSEAKDLFKKGYREVTLLGQNVDSYKWKAPIVGAATTFAQLLVMVAEVNPLLRVRFSTSHPKDITADVARAISAYPNICNYIHFPVQSGSSRILKLMNRTYDRDWYLSQIEMIRSHIPDIAFSTDIIAGFCSETEEDQRETLSLMEAVKFDYAYMFAYSERPGTPAAKKLNDDVPAEVKSARLAEIIALQRQHSMVSNQADVGRTFRVLVEGASKRSQDMLRGRNDANKMIIFPADGTLKPGDYADVTIDACTSATLIGTINKEVFA